MLLRLRALLFYTGITGALLIFSPLSLLTYPLPYRWRYRITTQWTRFSLWWLRMICGLRFEVSGREHVPPGPAIVMCKHQSAWETMATQLIFNNPQTFTLKRELLWIPLFGWGLATMDPIAINRRSRLSSARQIVEQGLDRLQRGIWVIIFPEGTRVAPGQTGRYLPGGGMLAEAAGCPVIPVAHNAGCFWPRNSIIKRSGIIRVVIGPAIDPRGKTAREITRAAETWIEPKAKELSEDCVNSEQ